MLLLRSNRFGEFHQSLNNSLIIEKKLLQTFPHPLTSHAKLISSNNIASLLNIKLKKKIVSSNENISSSIKKKIVNQVKTSLEIKSNQTTTQDLNLLDAENNSNKTFLKLRKQKHASKSSSKPNKNVKLNTTQKTPKANISLSLQPRFPSTTTVNINSSKTEKSTRSFVPLTKPVTFKPTQNENKSNDTEIGSEFNSKTKETKIIPTIPSKPKHSKSVEELALTNQLDKRQRFEIYMKQLSMKPAPGTVAEAIDIINKTIDEVEDKYAPKKDDAVFSLHSKKYGRMYPVPSERIKVNKETGKTELLTTGLTIIISNDGSFEIWTIPRGVGVFEDAKKVYSKKGCGLNQLSQSDQQLISDYSQKDQGDLKCTSD